MKFLAIPYTLVHKELEILPDDLELGTVENFEV